MINKIKAFGAWCMQGKVMVGLMALVGVLAGTSQAYAVDPTMQDLITSADTGFTSTVGFNIADVVTWSGDNLIKLFIGSGLAVLYSLRYWIIALVVISAIVYFAYRAFRFFKH
jgi:hypothetical protein